MLRINEGRFLQNLAELAQIGRLPKAEGGGLDRRPFSPAERAARDYFSQQAKAAGLAVFTDAAANISARLPGEQATVPTLLLGSHLDTVPNGGRYDGALGVIAALEVLRTVREAEIVLPVHLETIAFTDEEGRFGDFFGSRALIGDHTTASIEAFLTSASAYPEDLATMGDVVPGGLALEKILAGWRDPATIAGFIELHIEQGPRLEAAGKVIGVVDAIYGRRSKRIDFYGRSDHAGTTPLHMRADALVAAASFVVKASQIDRQQFPEAVITCGNITVKPGVYNVVPNEATVLVEFRAAIVDTLDEMDKALTGLVEESIIASEDLDFTITPTGQHDPVQMAPSFQTAIRQACTALSYPTMTLASGALHDAGLLATIAPTGMIFVPSIGGRSHNPDEDTDPADLIVGANTLLHTALIVAGQYRQQ